MALIGTIRNNGWILIALMVLALGGFIIMDIVSNAQNYSSGDANTIGKINGQTIERAALENADKLLFSDQGDAYATRQAAWNYLVEKNLIEQEAKELGLGVSSEELKQIMFGPDNLSPNVQKKYTNRQTGQVDGQALMQIRSALEGGQEMNPQFRAFWAELEKETVKDRLQRKLLNAVFKGVYTPNWLAEAVFNESNTRADFLFVKVPYDSIPDADAVPTDADFQAFYDESKETFRTQEEVRFMEYYPIDVLPTAADSANLKAGLEKQLADFRASTNDSVFCLTRNGFYNPYNYFKKVELGTAADLLLSAPLGTVVGPYFADQQRQYRIGKIIDRKAMPDSVKARHILIAAKAPVEFEAASKRIDSIRNLIAGGMRFDSLAKKFSQDPGSGAKGGDLGYFLPGTMVPEFNAVSCFTGTPGKLYKVKTQFGYHLIDILDRKYSGETGVQLAYLAANLEPSEETQAAAKEKAIALASKCKTNDDLRKEVEAMGDGAKIMTTNGMRMNDYNQNMAQALGSPDAVRDMTRWAFGEKTKKGNVSSEVYPVRDPNGGFYDAKYVIAAVKSVVPKGLANWQDVKAQIEPPVKNRKKAAVIKAKIGGTTDLAVVASMFGVKIDTAQSAAFSANQIGKVGTEMKVNGTMANLEAGQTSSLIDGLSGVFLMKMLSKTPPPPIPADMAMFKRQAGGRIQYDIQNGLMNSLKKNSDMKDFRFKFY